LKPSRFGYAVPTTLASAVELRAGSDDSVILNGGQSLLPTMNFRLSNPDLVIDLRMVAELDYITVAEDAVRVGATAKQRTVELEPSVHRANPLIREVLQNVAHPVIRNWGSVGGSLAHADPSAELPALLATLRGVITAQGLSGRRVIAAADFFEHIFATALEPDELLIEAAFPVLEADEGWSFSEFARRHGDFAVAGVAVTVKLDADGLLSRVQMGACGISTVPVVLSECEELLTGNRPTSELFARAGELAREAVTASDNSATSRTYRQHVLAGLVQKNLERAMTRVGGA
jgi:aerobic carbon-monoxide dehydrogenase medium subunit